MTLRTIPLTVVCAIVALANVASAQAVQLKSAGKTVPLVIRKSTGNVQIAGSYSFTVVCTGSGGPYTGTLSNPGTIQVPTGDTCTVTETQPTMGNWSTPTFSGAGVTPLAPWKATVAPNGGPVTVLNHVEMVHFAITKSTGAAAIPGPYQFTVTCNSVPAGYTVSVPAFTLAPSGTQTVTVPLGYKCTVTETQPSGNWNLPGFAGTNLSFTTGGGWSTTVGPITNTTGVLTVTNVKKK